MKIEVLGKVFMRSGQSSAHMANRTQKCRQAMYGIVFNNEELNSQLKAHLWKTIGVPTLMYSLSTGNISRQELKRLESFQGTMVKSCFYLSKRSHHSALLNVLGIDTIENLINQQRINLLQRVFKVRSSYSSL